MILHEYLIVLQSIHAQIFIWMLRKMCTWTCSLTAWEILQLYVRIFMYTLCKLFYLTLSIKNLWSRMLNKFLVFNTSEKIRLEKHNMQVSTILSPSYSEPKLIPYIIDSIFNLVLEPVHFLHFPAFTNLTTTATTFCTNHL